MQFIPAVLKKNCRTMRIVRHFLRFKGRFLQMILLKCELFVKKQEKSPKTEINYINNVELTTFFSNDIISFVGFTILKKVQQKWS